MESAAPIVILELFATLRRLACWSARELPSAESGALSLLAATPLLSLGLISLFYTLSAAK